MTAGYDLSEPGLVIGSPMHDGELFNEARVQVALSMLNRHGLIAGATGTGKTRTLQLLLDLKDLATTLKSLSSTDVPSSVLAQLGNRVQHALRAFTPDDADALRKTARTFPMTDFYDVERTITSLGTGEALVTVRSPNGVPTPLAATRLLAPDSLMAPIDEVQFRGRIATSPYLAKYGATVDRESAYERITGRLASARAAAAEAAMRQQLEPTTADGLSTMTPAQQKRAIARQAREMAATRRAAERERAAQARVEREAARARQRSVDNAIRTGGKVVTSRLGQDIIRGIFGTLFGGGKSADLDVGVCPGPPWPAVRRVTISERLWAASGRIVRDMHPFDHIRRCAVDRVRTMHGSGDRRAKGVGNGRAMHIPTTPMGARRSEP